MPGVDHHRRRPPRREAREHGVPGQEERLRAAPLEHTLDHLLAVPVGLRGGFGEHHGVLAGVEAEAVLEGVVPQGLDGVPAGVGAVGAKGRDYLKRRGLRREKERVCCERRKRKKDGQAMPTKSPLCCCHAFCFFLDNQEPQDSKSHHLLPHLHVIAAEAQRVAPGEQRTLLAIVAAFGRRLLAVRGGRDLADGLLF